MKKNNFPRFTVYSWGKFSALLKKEKAPSLIIVCYLDKIYILYVIYKNVYGLRS